MRASCGGVGCVAPLRRAYTRVRRRQLPTPTAAWCSLEERRADAPSALCAWLACARRGTFEAVMFRRAATATSEGEVRVSSPASRIVLTVFTGRVGSAQSKPVTSRFEEIIASMDHPIWVSDATQLTWFEPGSLTLGPRWFAAFRARGGQHCLVASRWDAAMMAARTMALGVGVRVVNYPSLAEALSAADGLLTQSK